MKITVSLEKVLPRIHSHLSIIGKRAVNQHGERFYEELTTSSHEDSIFGDLMCSASESIVSSISDICVYYEDSKGVTFEIINERWAKLDEKLSHDLSEALEGSIYRYIVFYCLGVFLSSIFPALSQEKFPTFGKTYLEMAESILKRIVDLSYLKRPDNFAGLTYDEMFRASSEEFEGNKIGLFTIQRNGITISSYNGTADKIADINVPVNVSELKNDSGYLDSITAELVCDALGYTPFDEDAFTKNNIREIAEIPSWAWGAKPKYSWYEINGLDEELGKKYDSSQFEADFDKTIKKYELGREFVKIGTGQFISDVYRNGNTVYFQTGDIVIPDSGSNVSWGEKTDSSVVLSVDNIKYALTLYKEDLFVREVRDGKVVIKAKYPLYSVGDISAYGYSEGNMPSGGVTSFEDLSDVPKPTSDKTQYWGWDNGYKWLDAPKGGGEPQSYSSLHIYKDNKLWSTYNPTTGDKSIYLDSYTKEESDAKYALKGDVGGLDEYDVKDLINETYISGLGFATKDYVDGEINDLNVDQYATETDLSTAVSGMDASALGYANQALADAKAYTNSQLDSQLENYVDLKTYQVIEGQKVFNAFTRIGEPEGFRTDLDAGNIGLRAEYPCIDFCKGETNPSYDYSVRLIEHTKGILEIWEAGGDPRLVIGGAMLSYDTENRSLKISDINGGGSINLYATGDVAAYSGLGSGFDTLTDLTLTNSLNINGSYLRGLAFTYRGVNYYGLNVADQPLVLGTPQLPVHLYNYKDYGLLAYKKARFFDKVEFTSDIDITTLRITSGLYVNPNDTNAKIYIGGSSVNYAVEKMFADGTNVYITINGKQYILANA